VDDLTAHRAGVFVDTSVTGTSVTPATPLTLGHAYQWEVQAVTNGDNASAWSTPTKFTVILAAPAGTAPNGPSQNATPTFTWGTVAHADSYDLRLDDTSAGNKQVLLKTAITTTSFTPTTPLVPGDSYEWFVRGRSNNKTVSAWSSPVAFSVTPLSQPALKATSKLIDSPRPSLSWSSVAGADLYRIRVQDASTGRVVDNFNVSGTIFTPSTPLAAGHAYQWQVQALSNNGNSSVGGSALRFTVINPFAGSYTGSYSGTTSTGQALGGTFHVTISIADVIKLSQGLSGQGSVNFSGSINVSGNVLINGVMVTFSLTGHGTISNGTATASGTFFGSAFGVSASGTWTLSATQLTGSPLDTPVLVAPSGSGVSTTPTYSWNAVPGATYYALGVVDLSSKGVPVFVNNDVTTTSFTPSTPLTAGHKYEWVLVAFDNQDDASATVSQTFTV
jgi:hypothetical protein